MAADWLNVIEIANPCAADWESMEGDERSRFCQNCAKTVYNLSAMTSLEAETLIRAKEGQTCIQLYRRQDGTIINRDCPNGLLRVRTWAQRAGVGLLSLIIFGGITWATIPGANGINQGKTVSSAVTSLWGRIWVYFNPEPEFDVRMGEMVCPGPPPVPQLPPPLPSSFAPGDGIPSPP